MRSLIITLILFISIISAIALNSHFVRKSADTIIFYTSVEEFQKAPEDATAHLESFWSKNKLLLEFSVGYRDIDKMSELILELREAIDSSRMLEAERLCALISNCASNIARLEHLSIENLL